MSNERFNTLLGIFIGLVIGVFLGIVITHYTYLYELKENHGLLLNGEIYRCLGGNGQ